MHGEVSRGTLFTNGFCNSAFATHICLPQRPVSLLFIHTISAATFQVKERQGNHLSMCPVNVMLLQEDGLSNNDSSKNPASYGSWPSAAATAFAGFNAGAAVAPSASFAFGAPGPGSMFGESAPVAGSGSFAFGSGGSGNGAPLGCGVACGLGNKGNGGASGDGDTILGESSGQRKTVKAMWSRSQMKK